MLLEIFNKGYVGLRFPLTLKMGHKRRKVENHCFRGWRSFCFCASISTLYHLFQGFSNGALGPLGGHEQRLSLGSFAVILRNPSVTMYCVFARVFWRRPRLMKVWEPLVHLLYFCCSLQRTTWHTVACATWKRRREQRWSARTIYKEIEVLTICKTCYFLSFPLPKLQKSKWLCSAGSTFIAYLYNFLGRGKCE